MSILLEFYIVVFKKLTVEVLAVPVLTIWYFVHSRGVFMTEAQALEQSRTALGMPGEDLLAFDDSMGQGCRQFHVLMQQAALCRGGHHRSAGRWWCSGELQQKVIHELLNECLV